MAPASPWTQPAVSHGVFGLYGCGRSMACLLCLLAPQTRANSASWTTLSVGNLGVWGGYTRLALDTAGHPRLLWYSKTSISTPGVFQYAECNTACTNAATGPRSPSRQHPTTILQPLFCARPARAASLSLHRYNTDHTGTYYDYCDANCTSAAQWHEVQINSAFLLFDFSLAFDTTGGAHLAYRDATNYPDSLGYAGVCRVRQCR